MEFINNKDLLNNLRNSLINQQQRKTNSDKTNEDKSETVFDAKNINDKKDDNSFYGNAVSLSFSQKKDEPKININDNANAALKSVLNNLLNNMQKPSNSQNTTDNKPNTQNINSATAYSKTANTFNNSKNEVKQDTSQQALQNLLNNLALNNRQKINVQFKPEVKADEKPVSQAEEPVNQTTSTLSEEPEIPETTITEPVVQESDVISVDLNQVQPNRQVQKVLSIYDPNMVSAMQNSKENNIMTQEDYEKFSKLLRDDTDFNLNNFKITEYSLQGEIAKIRSIDGEITYTVNYMDNGDIVVFKRYNNIDRQETTKHIKMYAGVDKEIKYSKINETTGENVSYQLIEHYSENNSETYKSAEICYKNGKLTEKILYYSNGNIMSAEEHLEDNTVINKIYNEKGDINIQIKGKYMGVSSYHPICYLNEQGICTVTNGKCAPIEIDSGEVEVLTNGKIIHTNKDGITKTYSNGNLVANNMTLSELVGLLGDSNRYSNLNTSLVLSTRGDATYTGKNMSAESRADIISKEDLKNAYEKYSENFYYGKIVRLFYDDGETTPLFEKLANLNNKEGYAKDYIDISELVDGLGFNRNNAHNSTISIDNLMEYAKSENNAQYRLKSLEKVKPIIEDMYHIEVSTSEMKNVKYDNDNKVISLEIDGVKYNIDYDDAGNVQDIKTPQNSSEINSVPTIKFPLIPEEKGNYSSDGILTIYDTSILDDNKVSKTWNISYSKTKNTRTITQITDEEGNIQNTIVEDYKYNEDGLVTWALLSEFDAEGNLTSKELYTLTEEGDFLVKTNIVDKMNGTEPIKNIEKIKMAKVVRQNEEKPDLSAVNNLLNKMFQLSQIAPKFQNTSYSFHGYETYPNDWDEDLAYLLNLFYTQNGNQTLALNKISFDKDGNIKSFKINDNRKIEISYNGNGDIKEYTIDNDGKIISYNLSYDDMGNLSNIEYHPIFEKNNNQTVSYDIQNGEIVQTSTHGKAGSEEWSLSYDADGNIIHYSYNTDNSREQYNPDTKEIRSTSTLSGITDTDIYSTTGNIYDTKVRNQSIRITDSYKYVRYFFDNAPAQTFRWNEDGLVGVQVGDTVYWNDGETVLPQPPKAEDWDSVKAQAEHRERVYNNSTAVEELENPINISDLTNKEMRQAYLDTLKTMSNAAFGNQGFAEWVADSYANQIDRETAQTLLENILDLRAVVDEGSNEADGKIGTYVTKPFNNADIFFGLPSDFVSPSELKLKLQKLLDGMRNDGYGNDFYAKNHEAIEKLITNPFATAWELQMMIDRFPTLNGKVELNEQQDGDCWLLAAINTLTESDMKRICKIQENGDVVITFAAGEYEKGDGTKFISDGTPITVKKEEYEANTYKNKTLSLGDSDVKVFEIAYYKLLEKNFLPLKDGGVIESAFGLLGKKYVESTYSFIWNLQKDLRTRRNCDRKFYMFSLFGYTITNWSYSAWLNKMMDNITATSCLETMDLDKIFRNGSNVTAGTLISNQYSSKNENENGETEIVFDEKAYVMDLEFKKDIFITMLGYDKNEVNEAIELCKRLVGNSSDGYEINIKTKNGDDKIIFGSHAYTVKSYKDGYVELLNPHNNQETFEISEILFKLLFGNITVAMG